MTAALTRLCATPGPWTVLNHHGVFVLAEGGLTVAEVSYMLPDKKGETTRLANAALLAAAHDLLAALCIHHEWSIRNMPGYSEHGDERVAYRATAGAILKATGSQS